LRKTKRKSIFLYCSLQTTARKHYGPMARSRAPSHRPVQKPGPGFSSLGLTYLSRNRKTKKENFYCSLLEHGPKTNLERTAAHDPLAQGASPCTNPRPRPGPGNLFSHLGRDRDPFIVGRSFRSDDRPSILHEQNPCAHHS
jgi:hypothetical protein